jgi:hypothetical protein
MLAVQKASITEVTRLSQSNAKRAASASRLGGFMDWHLPDYTEMSVLIANLPLNTLTSDYYWTSYSNIYSDKGKVVSKDNEHFRVLFSETNDYVIVRKFLRK